MQDISNHSRELGRVQGRHFIELILIQVVTRYLHSCMMASLAHVWLSNAKSWLYKCVSLCACTGQWVLVFIMSPVEWFPQDFRNLPPPRLIFASSPLLYYLPHVQQLGTTVSAQLGSLYKKHIWQSAVLLALCFCPSYIIVAAAQTFIYTFSCLLRYFSRLRFSVLLLNFLILPLTSPTLQNLTVLSSLLSEWTREDEVTERCDRKHMALQLIDLMFLALPFASYMF